MLIVLKPQNLAAIECNRSRAASSHTTSSWQPTGGFPLHVGRPSISHDPSLCYIAHPHVLIVKSSTPAFWVKRWALSAFLFCRGTKGANEGRYEIPSLLRKHIIWKRQILWWFSIVKKFQRGPMPFRCHPRSFVITKSEAVEKAERDHRCTGICKLWLILISCRDIKVQLFFLLWWVSLIGLSQQKSIKLWTVPIDK